MRITRLCLTAALLCAPIAARADELLFTFVVPTVEPGDPQNQSFLLASDPTPTSYSILGESTNFEVPYTLTATDIQGTEEVIFYLTNGGPLDQDITIQFGDYHDGPQLFTGTLANPIFAPGVYSLDSGFATLTITDVSPEPSSIVLLSTGLLGAVGIVRRRIVG